jgi:O-antigen ligase
MRARLAGAGVAVLVLAATSLVLAFTRVGERAGALMARMQGGQSFGTRGAAWESTLDALRDFPIAGVGFGAFRDVYPAYMPRGSVFTTSQVHNDYLEVLVEGGLVAGLLVAWLIVAYAVRVLRQERRLVPGASVARLGLLLGIGSLAAHALVDFNHQIPANALSFVAVCALALPAGGDDEDDEEARAS